MRGARLLLQLRTPHSITDHRCNRRMTAKTKTSRGEYRAIRTVVVNGPQFRKLAPNSKLVWFYLKLQLGPSGIDVMNAAEHVVADQTGLAYAEVVMAFDELQQSPTPTHSPWLRRDGNVLEIVDGLLHEPALSMDNANHRKSLADHLDGLPNLKIVNDFRRRYLGDDRANDNPIPDAMPHTMDNGIGEGIPEGVVDQGLGIKEDGEGIRDQGKRSKSPPPTPASSELHGNWFVDPATHARVVGMYAKPDDIMPLAAVALQPADPIVTSAQTSGMAGAELAFAQGVAGVLARIGRHDVGTLMAVLGNCRGALQGMHGPTRTFPELVTNLQDYAMATIEGTPSGAHFRAFLYRDPAVEQKPRASSNGAAATPDMTLAAGELANKLRKARKQSTVGDRVGSFYLPADWQKDFAPHEVRAIEAIGSNRVLAAEGEQRGIMLGQLAKALLAARSTPTTTTETPTT